MTQTAIIWYRYDLRIHDHEPLWRALQAQYIPLPLYCLDPRQFTQTSYGFPKTGAKRAQFLLESLGDLRQSLQNLGSNLLVRQGFPELIIPALATATGATAIYWYREVTSEEVAVEKAVQKVISQLNLKVKTFWGSTLYHFDDLPFNWSELPELFTNFRQKLEKNWLIRPCFPTPKQLPALPDLDLGRIPRLEELNLKFSPQDPRGVLEFHGGESEGKKRLEDYFWQTNSLQDYKETRNGLLGANYSSKFSPWLAQGCLSPRYVYEQVKAYETARVKNQSTYWLIFELLWRDFFRFIALKHGNEIFQCSGLQKLAIPWQKDWEKFDLWRTGKTGYPLVDANMRELAATGFMSNRGRQNVASFLTKNLGINWQIGAEWFESSLIDYDVCSNWGNWNYTAGVGNDARGFRYFNIPKQSKEYDPEGKYIRHWLPELANLPGEKIHEPWKLSREEQHRYRVQLGVDYPKPMVDFLSSIKRCETVYNQAVNKRKLGAIK